MYKSIDLYYKLHARIYDKTRWLFLFGRKELHTLLPDFPEIEQLKILEVGCGTGFHLSRLSHNYENAHITGIDSSTHMLKVARRKELDPGINLLEGSYSSETFPEANFDLIICSYSLTMVGDIEGSLEALKMHLKPGGFLLVADFHQSKFSLFIKWMNKNFVDLYFPLFRRLQEEFTTDYFAEHKAYLNLWSYGVFKGRKPVPNPANEEY